MSINKKLSRMLGIGTLVLALGMMTFEMKPRSIYHNETTLSGLFDRLVLINQAMAGTDILTGGDGNLPHHLRFMYFLINGAPNGYPDGMNGPEGGLLGMIRQVTGPTALGAGLRTAGYSVCSDVPASGSAEMVEEGNGTFTMFFEPPQRTIPAGYTGAGNTFEKRVVVQFDGTTFFNIEFNCSSTVGWIRMNMGENNPTSGTPRNIEAYYDTEDPANAKLELYMTYEPGVATGNEYFVAKFQTTSSSTYKFWLIRAQNKTGNVYGFRAAVHGDSETDNANAFFMAESGSMSDVTTNHTNNGNIDSASGGDIQCIDYSDPANPVAGSGCGSLTLDSSAGNPINDAGDGFSIEWTGNTTNGLKADMTTLAEPVNP